MEVISAMDCARDMAPENLRGILLDKERLALASQWPAVPVSKAITTPPNEGFYEVMELAYRHMTPLALNAAVLLGIPDMIARSGPDAKLTIDEMLVLMPRKNGDARDHIGRLMRILVLSDVFSEEVTWSEEEKKMESRFGLTSISQWLVSSGEFNLGPMILMKMSREMMNCFLHIHSAVLDGADPFEATNGTDLFHYTKASPQFNKVFNDALTCRAKTFNWTIANNYQGFSDIKTLVDVGGCQGQALASIVGKHPHIQGINFDLAHVVATAPNIPGVKHIAGDMFKSIPEADAVIMEQILHDWNDAKCIEILRKCYAATPDHGRVIIRDNVLRPTTDRSPQARVAHAANLGMLSYCGQGKERTAEEWRSLIATAGFHRVNFLNFSGLDVLEVLKK